jgi:hypothetical protein
MTRFQIVKVVKVFQDLYAATFDRAGDLLKACPFAARVLKEQGKQSGLRGAYLECGGNGFKAGLRFGKKGIRKPVFFRQKVNLGKFVKQVMNWFRCHGYYIRNIKKMFKT